MINNFIGIATSFYNVITLRTINISDALRKFCMDSLYFKHFTAERFTVVFFQCKWQFCCHLVSKSILCTCILKYHMIVILPSHIQYMKMQHPKTWSMPQITILFSTRQAGSALRNMRPSESEKRGTKEQSCTKMNKATAWKQIFGLGGSWEGRTKIDTLMCVCYKTECVLQFSETALQRASTAQMWVRLDFKIWNVPEIINTS